MPATKQKEAEFLKELEQYVLLSRIDGLKPEEGETIMRIVGEFLHARRAMRAIGDQEDLVRQGYIKIAREQLSVVRRLRKEAA